MNTLIRERLADSLVEIAGKLKANTSEIDEEQAIRIMQIVALYIRDVIDDIDAPDGLVFNRWYADMCYCGIAIDWEDML